MYLKQCRACGSVVLPYWPSASFWPLIVDDHGFIKEAIAHVELPVGEDYYVPGKAGDRSTLQDIRFDFSH